MSILFKNAKIIKTENEKLVVLPSAYLGVKGDTISYIGTEKPREEYSEEKDMSRHILMPGLINGHTHAAMDLLRGIGSDLPLDEWLHTMWPIEDKMRDEEFISGMEMAILEMLSSGTTSFSDMYMRPFITAPVIEKSGIKANMTRVIMGGDDRSDYLTFPNRTEALYFFNNFNGAYDGRLLVDWGVHAEYTINENIALKWGEEIQRLGGRVHIHLAETKKEVDECIAKKGKSPVEWFNDYGYFNIQCNAAHSVWLSDNDLKIMKEKGVNPIHNPSSNMKLGSGFAPVDKMLKMGLNVALGTDGSASNNNLNMFEEMHLASIIHNGYTGDPTIMKSEDVIKMATLNGARLQGRNDTGSLEVGKKADIIAVDCDKPHLIPDLDTLALIVYSSQGSDVDMTMVNGKILYEKGEYKTMDKERIVHDFLSSVDYLNS